VAAALSTFERPGAVRVIGVDQHHAGRQFDHCEPRDAVFHFAAEHAAIKTLGLGHAAYVEQQVIEAERLERRYGHLPATAASRDPPEAPAPWASVRLRPSRARPRRVLEHRRSR